MTHAAAVVHVVVAGEVGGAERMLVDLASDTRHRRHSVALMTPNPELRSLFLRAGLEVDDRGHTEESTVAFLRSTFGRRDHAWLTSVLRQRGASIVHLHTFASQVLGARAALAVGARIVRTEHSTRVFDDPSCWPFARWSLRRAHASIAVSQHVRDVALARAPWAGATMTVIPNGVDLTHFREMPWPPLTSARPLRLIAVGRLDRRKGFDMALQAVAKVPGCELTIVGEGEEREALASLSRALGLEARVRFAGYASDVRPRIAEADVALSSARKEGLGIALLEAMALGRPVLALPTGGVVEFVEDGVTGWLAAASTPEALEGSLRALVNAIHTHGWRPLEDRGRAARALVEARYSVTSMRAAYEAVYARLHA